MRVEKTIRVVLTHDELCEAVCDWVYLHSSGVEITISDVEFLTDDLVPFAYDITARATERS